MGSFIILMLFLFKNKIIKPIVILSEKSKELSQGNFEIIFPDASSVEEAKLIEALKMIKISFESESKMKNKLYEANTKIKKINESLEIIVEKRTENLEQKVLELKQALIAKTEFLNNMSHEVRIPIQGIINISQSLIDYWHDYKDDERLFFAGKVAQYSQRLISLVSNLLDLSKFGTRKIMFKIERNDLITLLEEMTKETRDLYINDKNIKLVFNSALTSAPLNCDSDKITQLLRNLFANAIKFTPKGIITVDLIKTMVPFYNIEKSYNGKDKTIIDDSDIDLDLESENEYIDIKNIKDIKDEDVKDEDIEESLVECDPDFVEVYKIIISDEGLGIPFGEEESIFEPFTQSTRTKTRAGGTGLGLALCQKIVNAHSGKIYAVNNQDNADVSDYNLTPEIADYIHKYILKKLSFDDIESMPKLPGATFTFFIPTNLSKDRFGIDLIDSLSP